MLSRAQTARLQTLEREEALYRARRGLLAFTCYTYPEFRVSWHHRVICRTLNRFARGEITRLIIEAPPRHGKSELMSRRLPAFLLGQDPNTRIIAASYSDALASDMNRDCQRIITCDAYRELFPKTRLNEKNIRTVADGVWLRNSEMFEVVGSRGYYKSAGIGGAITGRGGDKLLLDDFLKDWASAQSKTIRDSQWDWFRSVFMTRLQKGGQVAMTVTRWNEDDIVGRVTSLMKVDPSADKWHVLTLPAIKEDEPTDEDPRSPGEALWPDEFPIEQLRRTETNVGPRIWVSLYQQRPSPAKGNVIEREQWKRFSEWPDIATMDAVCSSWDLTFKDKEKNDWTVCVILGRKGADKYLLGLHRRRIAFPEQLRLFTEVASKLPTRANHYIEDAANGAAMVAIVTRSIPRVIAVTPNGSKQARAEAIAPQAAAGNLWLPDSNLAPYIETFIEEWAIFPSGKHDDQVDAYAQGVLQLDGKYRSYNIVLTPITGVNRHLR